MPKGKPRAKNPGLYEDDDSSGTEERSKAPQAAVHARGGRWEVRDDLKTGTHWDLMHHVDLKSAAEEAGVYRKDMAKVEMIHALAKKDRLDELERRAAEKEKRRKRRMAEIEERKKRAEKITRKKDRERRRVQGEDYVSDTTKSESDGGANIETDDESSISTSVTPTTPSFAFMFPAQRLRIFEWPYGGMPPTSPLRVSTSPSSARSDQSESKLLPRGLPYAVMKVVTTASKEKLELPGRQYSEEAGPDYVLPLSEHTKDCARNGVLYGQLRRAVIERGADWAERTQVQWWNGCMSFHLPPRGASKKVLADVYAKWNKKQKLERSAQKRGSGIDKVKSKRKAAQRLQDQRQKMLDIYAVSEHRPPICYMPAYLDFPVMYDDDDVRRSIDNLFYIRFLDADLPHYYFWSVQGEWEDPTEPNPEWLESIGNMNYATVNYGDRNPNRRHSIEKILVPENVRDPRKILVKRSTVPRKFQPSSAPPKTSQYRTVLWAFERDLYNKGLGTTLKEAHERWTQDGKVEEWVRLIKNLPSLHPAGQLPTSPPADPHSGVKSLAEKFAAIELPSYARPVESIIGDEPWTRDDEAYWDIVHLPPILEDSKQELLRAIDSPATPAAIGRESGKGIPSVTAWMGEIPATPDSPSLPPRRRPSTPLSARPLNSSQFERMNWEQLFFHNVESKAALSTIAEQFPDTELKHSIHRAKRQRNTRSAQGSEQSADGTTQSASTTPKMSKVSFSPVTVERRVAYNDKGGNEDADISPISAMSPKRSSLKKPSIESNSKKPLKSALKINTSFGTPLSRARTKNNETQHTTFAISEYDDTDYVPPTASTQPANPQQRRDSVRGEQSKRRKQFSSKRHSDATWNPEDYSPSPHISSPYLSTSKHYPDGHPDAAWDPRKASSSTVESLGYYTRKRGPLGKNNTVATLQRKGNSLDSRRLSNTEHGKGRRRKRVLIDDGIIDGSASVNVCQPLPTITRSSAKGENTKERPSSKARRLNVQGSLRTTRRDGRRDSHTKKNVASKHDLDFLNDLSFSAGVDFIPFDSSAIREDNSSDVLTGNPFAPQPGKQRIRTPTTHQTRSTSRLQHFSPKTPVLFSTLTTKSKTPKQIALETKKAAASSSLTSRRAAKQGAENKTALKEEIHIAQPQYRRPLCKQNTTHSPESTKSSTGGLSDILSPPTPTPRPSAITHHYLTVNPTPDFESSDEQRIDTIRRGRRSSAPTPSPTLASHHGSPSTPHSKTNSTLIDRASESAQVGTKMRIVTLPDQEKTKRKASYDVPWSDQKLVVPPNTPADHLELDVRRGTRRKSTRRSDAAKHSRVNGEEVVSAFDARQLSDSIEEVRGGNGGLKGKAKKRGMRVDTTKAITRATAVTVVQKPKGELVKNVKKTSTIPSPRPTRRLGRHSAPVTAPLTTGRPTKKNTRL